MSSEIRFRRFDSRDAECVAALDEWTMRETSTDPEDIPGHEDVHDVESAYIDTGGDFVVGILATAGRSDDGESAGRNGDSESAGRNGDSESAGRNGDSESVRRKLQCLETFDGLVVAMGGFLPNEAGHEDERAVPGAAELHRMRVAPPYQRRGYGKLLLRELERRATDAGFTVLLATTAKRQEPATRFYPGAGYDSAGESTFDEYELLHFEKRCD